MALPVSQTVPSVVTTQSLPVPFASTQSPQQNPIVTVAKTVIESAQQEDLSKKRSLAENSVVVQKPPAKAPKIEGRSEGPSKADLGEKVAASEASLTIEQKIEKMKTDLWLQVDKWTPDMNQTIEKNEWFFIEKKKAAVAENVAKSKAKISGAKDVSAFLHALDTSKRVLEKCKSLLGKQCAEKIVECEKLYEKTEKSLKDLSAVQPSEKAK